MESVLPASFAFETHPARYQHWHVIVEPPLATMILAVRPDAMLDPGYGSTHNSFDLVVELELADAVNRLRFEHPDVRVVILTSADEQVFSAGIDRDVLAGSSEYFRSEFFRYVEENRLSIEEASAQSGQRYIAACNGAAAGGGYELALACDEIHLVDDGASAVSLPQVSSGWPHSPEGVRRLFEKRKVRRDRVDVFCTSVEGIKGRRALEWRLVDGVFPRARFHEAVRERALTLAATAYRRPKGAGIRLEPLSPVVSDASIEYRHVALGLDLAARVAELTVHGPEGEDFTWPLRAFREIDDALLRLRFGFPEIRVVLLKTHGSLDAVRRLDEVLFQEREDWLVHETLLLMGRTLRRLDLTARSLFAIVERDSCFAGSLLELALAADRAYMLREEGVQIALTALNDGPLPMSNGVPRLTARNAGPLPGFDPVDAMGAVAAGLVTAATEEIDWEEEVRITIADRAALPRDVLDALEANLRYAGSPRWRALGRRTGL